MSFERAGINSVVCGLARVKVLLVLGPFPGWAILEVRVSWRSGLFQANEADAVSLDAGLVAEAGLTPNTLKPVVAEFYGSHDSEFSPGSQEGVVALVSS
jgi:hypothetical protein